MVHPSIHITGGEKGHKKNNFFGPYGRVKVSSGYNFALGGAETSLQVSSVSPHTKEFHFWAKWPKGNCVCEILSVNFFMVEGCLTHLSHPMSIKPLGRLVTLTLHIGPKVVDCPTQLTLYDLDLSVE